MVDLLYDAQRAITMLEYLHVHCTTFLPKFYPVNLRYSNYDRHVFTSRVESNLDSDQLALTEAS